MWARVIEIMLGGWLALGGFMIVGAEGQHSGWLHDFACAAAIIAFALLSFWPRFQKAHLLGLAVAVWLIGIGFIQPDPPPLPVYQNYVLVGALLIMFAIVPSRASDPPRRWREFYEQHGERTRRVNSPGADGSGSS